jgi:hypothetical protein
MTLYYLNILSVGKLISYAVHNIIFMEIWLELVVVLVIRAGMVGDGGEEFILDLNPITSLFAAGLILGM